MITIYKLKERADALAKKTETGSITPEEVGVLLGDMLDYSLSIERDGGTLGIRKIYPNMQALRADKNPTTANGKPLHRGNLVAIYNEATANTDTDSGLVLVYTGEGFEPVARIGTALRNENTAIENRVTKLEKDVTDLGKLIATAQDNWAKTLQSLSNEYTRRMNDLETRVQGLEESAVTSTELANEVKARQDADNTLSDAITEGLDEVRRDVSGVRGDIATAVADERKARIKSMEELEERVTETANSAGRIKEIKLNGETLPVGQNGDVNITTVVTDTALDKGSSNAVSNSAVSAKFEELDGKYGTQLSVKTTGEGADKAVAVVLLNDAGEELSSTEYFQAGGGGGGSTNTSATRIELTKLTENPTLRRGDACVLAFGYDHVQTSNGDSTGNVGKATVTITRGASRYTLEMTLSAGATSQLDISRYLDLGTTSVRLRVEAGDDDAKQVATLSWQVQVVQLHLTSSFNIATSIVAGDSVQIPYSLSGSGAKTLRLYVDGIDKEDRTITTSSANGSFTLSTAGMSHGSHSVQLVAELEVQQGRTTHFIKSNSIYFDIAVRVDGVATPIVATRFDNPDGHIVQAGERPKLVAKQYDAYELVYAVVHPKETPTAVQVYEGDKKVSDVRVAFTATRLSLRSAKQGEVACRIVAGETEYRYTLAIDGSSINLQEPVDGLALHLSAEGRTNVDSNRLEWDYKGVQTTFEGFTFGGDGWQDGALRLSGDARATIQHTPLKSKATSNEGFAFVARLRATSVVDEDAPILSCLDSEGKGFVITPTNAEMRIGTASVSRKIASGEVYEIGFVSMPKADGSSNEYERASSEMVYLYINGIICGAVQRPAGASIYQGTPQPISVGSDRATLDLFEVRTYERYLSDDEMLTLYTLGQNAENLKALHAENDILSSEGDVRVDSVPEGIRVVIITGQNEATGTPSVLHAASINNKSARYDITSILSYVKGGKPDQNFYVDGGCIRLQGTSSLAYPIKNYRIYTVNSKKVKAEVRVGCDELGAGGTIAENSLYSFRPAVPGQPAPAPVNCWCLKADYAESSSSHNTGMARMVHSALTRAGYLTPPQKDVDAKRYPYDVRTTIDGEPCLLFYRSTESEEPKFLGKYNFNNDKSTEAVFGFRDIPGYHDAPWVNSRFGGQNPTECWEFLNNDYPMGLFLDDDFEATADDGTPRWLKTFEARYPDSDALNAQYESGEKKPEYLMRLVKWIKSTNTKEKGLSKAEIERRKRKFRNELSEFFDVNYLCAYYMLTEMEACVDQRVKNMMFAFFYVPSLDKVLCFPIFYDNDTIKGLRNDGREKYHWDIDHNTIDAELSTADKTVYAFAGHDSVLWENLRECFADELADAYRRLRAVLSDEEILRFFDAEQVDRYPERIFNIDALNKYIKPKTIGVATTAGMQKYSHLESLHGDRKSHRHWFVRNRMALLDARYSTGRYTGIDITWKGNSEAGAKVEASASRPFYMELRREGTTMLHQRVDKGETFSYTYDQMANIGTIFHLLGGAWMSRLDLSGWGGFTDLSIPTLPVLEELILGADGKTCALSELALGNNLPMLRALDMRGYTHISSLNLSGCKRLERVDARGCTRLSSLTFAESAPLTELRLPEGYQTLSLVALPKLTRSGIHLADIARLVGLRIERCPNIDALAMLREVRGTAGSQLRYVRIDVGSMSGDGSGLRELYTKGFGGLDERGNPVVGKCKLLGSYQLTQYIDDAELARWRAYFDELTIRQPEYTMVEYDDSVADPANISNLDNHTGYKYGTPYQPSAHIARILSDRFGCLGKQESKGVMKICPLHNDTWLKFGDNTVASLATDSVLDMTQGDVYIYEPRYWYKGINDLLNNKKYACYASGDAPSAPKDITVVTFLDIERQGDKMNGYSVRIAGSKLTDCLSPDAEYTTYKVAVQGYQRVRYQSVLGAGLRGAVFTSEDGTVVSSQALGESHPSFVDGMYIIANVPSTATHLHFCVMNGMSDDDIVVLSNSPRIEDLEPAWVEHPATLVGAYAGILLNSKYGSGLTDNGMTGITDGITVEQMTTTLQARGLQPMSYDQYKDIANLAYLKYGTRHVVKFVGTIAQNSVNDYINRVGDYVATGVGDSVKLSTGKQGYYAVKGVEASFREVLNNNKIMGYERLTGGYSTYLSEISLSYPKGAEATTIAHVTRSGTQSLLSHRPLISRCVGAVRHEKYMDVLSITPMGNVQASEETYYATKLHLGVYNTAPRMSIGRGRERHESGIDNYMLGFSNLKDSHTKAIVSRIMYRGKIEVVKDVELYKKIKGNF